MKVRADFALVSSVLFTLALLWLKPIAMFSLSSGAYRAKLDPSDQFAASMADHFGVASLAIILIGLIVVWTGYVRRSRSAWVVMAVITWAWAFPLFAWPYLKGPRVFTLPEWIYNAIYEPGLPRSAAQQVLIVALMVIALLLPIRSFFFAGATAAPTQGLSFKRLSRFAVAVFLIVIALFVWIHVQVYELPRESFTNWQVAPPPPPPPIAQSTNEENHR